MVLLEETFEVHCTLCCASKVKPENYQFIVFSLSLNDGCLAQTIQTVIQLWSPFIGHCITL